MKMPRKNKTKN